MKMVVRGSTARFLVCDYDRRPTSEGTGVYLRGGSQLSLMANQRMTKLPLGAFLEDETRAARVLVDALVPVLVLGFVAAVITLYLTT